MENKNVNFVFLLSLLFIGLKLCKVINWSWIWVLSPLWIGWGIVLILVVLVKLFKK